MHARSEPQLVPTPDRTGASSPIERLWSRYHRRPTLALRNRLVEHYQPHVLGIARRFALRLPPSVERGDLETAASFGLIAAIEGFDPTRGVAFEAYCERRVRGALLDELRSQDWMPRPMRARTEELRRVREQLRAQLEREPLDVDLAQALDLSLEQFDQLFGPGARATPNPGRAMHLEIVEDPRSVMEEGLEPEELYRLVYARLTRIESKIVHLRYWEERSLREIGTLLAMSESQVCKIHLRVLERLKLRISEQDI